MASGNRRALIGLVIAATLLVGAVIGVVGLVGSLGGRGVTPPADADERCVATAAGRSVAVDLEQARYASIIVGVSVRRGLPPRAATIALATAYQESDIRNLDYGDRDSVGLFQQRPSQGWGTVAQLQDPYYATGKFYDALVKVRNWRRGDVNDVAQRVQRSGYPEAYRDHEADARVLASTLTGRSPRGFSCLVASKSAGKSAALASGLAKTFGPAVGAKRSGSTVTIAARSDSLAWAYAGYAVANAKTYGLVSAEVGRWRWRTSPGNLPQWTETASGAAATRVRLTVG